MLQYNNLVKQMRRTGGGTLPEDIIPYLTRQDELSLAYQGFITAAGKSKAILHKAHFSECQSKRTLLPADTYQLALINHGGPLTPLSHYTLISITPLYPLRGSRDTDLNELIRT